MNSELYAEATLELARGMGSIALADFTRPLTVEIKCDGSPVTRADRLAEQFARTWIASRFPNDGIDGEEFGNTGGSSSVSWIIDPIDGTKSFIRGVPLWGSLVAVAENGVVIAGAAHFPALSESIVAGIGGGCWWNGKRAQVSDCDQIGKALILTSDESFFEGTKRTAWDNLSKSSALTRTWGDCYGYLLVATGRAEAMLDVNLARWDSAPFGPIISEAGGSFTDWSGSPASLPRDAVVCNRNLAPGVLQILRTSMEGR